MTAARALAEHVRKRQLESRSRGRAPDGLGVFGTGSA